MTRGKNCPTSAPAPSASASTWGWGGCKNKTQMEDEKKGSSTVPVVYDANADIEEEYRLFLENVCVYENEDFVVEYEGKVIRYEGQTVTDGGSREVLVKEEKKKIVLVINSDESSNDCAMGVPNPNPFHHDVPSQKAKMVEDQKRMDQKKTSIFPPNGEDAATEESPGVIWPAHIKNREESEFKQRLIAALCKPFSQEEYAKLYDMATTRNPLMKERHMRSGVKLYYSEFGIEKSYFDCYPDLAKQVEEASYPNRLALLRGLFFWLENVGQDHQFRPWRDDHKHYKVVFV